MNLKELSSNEKVTTNTKNIARSRRLIRTFRNQTLIKMSKLLIFPKLLKIKENR